jgi:tetratricopeptide (TPR) repeat protein
MLVQLALDVVQRDIEQALIVLQAIADSYRRTRGLIKLAERLNRQFDDNSQFPNYQLLYLPSRDLYQPVGALARHDSQLALRVVRALPNRAEQATACAVTALTLRDEQLEQGRTFLEQALNLGQIQPVTVLKTIAYLELNECISDEHAQINLIQKAISSLPISSIPGALPKLTKHLVGHLARRGEIERALQIAQAMTATHLILDTPDKVLAFLEIAELAIAQGKVPLGREILDEALNLIRITSYALPALPRLASLMHSFDPTRANKLFDVTIQCAMDREMSMHRAQILQRVVHFQAPFKVYAALEAARKIPDPYQKADALLTAVIRGDLLEDETMNIVREAEELLAANSSNALVKGQALLKLVGLNLSERSNPLELIREAIQTLRQTQPADWYRRIGLLTQAYHHCRQLGAYDLAQEIISEVLEVARSDPFEQSAGMAQAAKLYLNYDANKAVAIVFEILRRAHLKDYDALWKAITAIVPIICELGGDSLARQIYKELDLGESFLRSIPSLTSSQFM